MNNRRTIPLVFLYVLGFIAPVVAQDSVLFISGRILEGNIKQVDSLDVQIEIKKGKKTKVLYESKSDIFAIKYSDGKSEIFYAPINSEEYSIREMELFVKGEQDAIAHTKAPILLVSGIIIGGTSTFLLGPVWGLGPILPFALVGGSLNSKIKEGSVSNPDLLREDTYLTGYTTKAKSIKIQKAIIGSIIGWVSGMVVGSIAQELNKEE